MVDVTMSGSGVTVLVGDQQVTIEVGEFTGAAMTAAVEAIAARDAAGEHATDAEIAAAIALAAAAPFITLPLETSAAYFTPTLAQAGAFLRMSHARGSAFIVPSNAHVAFPAGCVFQVEAVGDGQAMVLAEAGVTLIARDNQFGTAGPGSVLTIKRAAADVWVVTGDAAAAKTYLLEGESWNPADKGPSVDLTEAHLRVQIFSDWNAVRGTKAIPALAGGVYWEDTMTDVAGSTYAATGIATASAVINAYDFANRILYEKGGSTAGAGGATLATFTDGDVIGKLVKNGKIYFRKNGTWLSCDPIAETGGFDITGLGGAIHPVVHGDNINAVTTNFGARAFANTAPAGAVPYSPLGVFPRGYMAVPSDFSASYGTAQSSARFRAALANPTPRIIATTDPLTFTPNAASVSATTIANGNTVDLSSGFLRPIGGQPNGTSGIFSIPQLHRDGTSAPTGTDQSVTALEVVYTGTKLEFTLQSRGQRVHVFVDGVKSNRDGYVMTNVDGFKFCPIDFGTPTTRRIQVCQENNCTFGPVRIEDAYQLLDPTPKRPCNMLVMGDSFWETDFPSHKIDGIPTRLREMLGVDNLIAAAQGGKGFLAGDNGTGPAVSGVTTIANYRGRIDLDLTLTPPLDPRFDVILFAASGNDAWFSGSGISEATWQAMYAANVDYCLNAARTAWPEAVIMCIGHANGEGTYGNNTLYKERVLAAKCQQYGAIWAHGMTQAMDDLESTLKTGDELGWYHPDGHPNDAGHTGLARLMRNCIRDAMV
jgi:hypothetical protein